MIELIRDANTSLGTTVVAVTHDPAVAAALGRTITIRDGRVGAEGLDGQEYVVVGRDGTLQLPAELTDLFPPGRWPGRSATSTACSCTRWILATSGTPARAGIPAGTPAPPARRASSPRSGPVSVIEARGLRYAIGGRLLLAGFDLTVGPGERVAVVGPSGSG